MTEGENPKGMDLPSNYTPDARSAYIRNVENYYDLMNPGRIDGRKEHIEASVRKHEEQLRELESGKNRPSQAERLVEALLAAGAPFPEVMMMADDGTPSVPARTANDLVYKVPGFDADSLKVPAGTGTLYSNGLDYMWEKDKPSGAQWYAVRTY